MEPEKRKIQKSSVFLCTDDHNFIIDIRDSILTLIFVEKQNHIKIRDFIKNAQVAQMDRAIVL